MKLTFRKSGHLWEIYSTARPGAVFAGLDRATALRWVGALRGRGFVVEAGELEA